MTSKIKDRAWLMSTVPLTSEAVVDAICSQRVKRAGVVLSLGGMAYALVVPSLFIQTRRQAQDVFIAPGQSGVRFVGLVACLVAVFGGCQACGVRRPKGAGGFLLNRGDSLQGGDR
jgi:hypothetical protein